MSKCKTVTLRKRKIKNGTQYSLCLDYYPGYRDNSTMKVITREALGELLYRRTGTANLWSFGSQYLPYRQGKAYREDKSRTEKPPFTHGCRACYGRKKRTIINNCHYSGIIQEL